MTEKQSEIEAEALEAGAPAPRNELDLPPNQEILERLEPLVRPGHLREAATVVQSMLVQQSHSGPLPTAREFSMYDQALPGAAERILALAEREQKHRQGLESVVVNKELSFKGRGQTFALTALVASLLVVCLFVYLDHPAAGASFGATVVVGVVALFLGQRLNPGAASKQQPPEAPDE